MPAPDLTIRDIVTRAVEVPMRRPLGTSAGTIRTAPLVLIDLETEEGVTGRAYLFCYLPAAAPLVRGALTFAGSLVAGDRVAPAEVLARVRRRFVMLGYQGIVGMAAAGLEVACWDALGQAVGLPLARLLGGDLPPVPAYNSNGLGLMDEAAAADEAEALLAEGFHAVKLRLGRPTLEADLAAVRAVRRRIPDEAALMVDYNQALTPAEAVRRGLALDGEGIAWIEEPVPHDDYAGCARVAREVATPVQIGENFAGPRAMAAALAAGACDHVMPDLQRIGGVTGWLAAAALADAAGMEMSSHLFPEVSAHLLAVTPTRHWLEYVDWAAPVLAEPLRIADGRAVLSDRAGTGVVWDEDAVGRYLVP